MRSPKTILTISQKGGVGKTTIADELLFAIERRGSPYSFYELDSQGGTIHKPVENRGSVFTVVDTPGGLCGDTPKWIAASDLVILPTKPSFRDLEPFLRMGSIIRKNLRLNAAALFVVNMMNVRFRATKEFMAWMETAIGEGREPFGRAYNWSFGLIPQSEMAVQAGAYKKSITDFAPKSEISSCIQKLNKKVFELLGV